jgi:hypothetical protein
VIVIVRFECIEALDSLLFCIPSFIINFFRIASLLNIKRIT